MNTIIILNLIAFCINLNLIKRAKESDNYLLMNLFTISLIFSLLIGFLILFVYFCIILDTLYYEYKNKD